MRAGMILRSLLVVVALGLCAAAGPASAAANAWFDWQAARDGAQHTYTSNGLTLRVSSRPGTAADDNAPTPVLTVSAPGAPPLTLIGAPANNSQPEALIGVVRMDASSARPQVLFQTFSDGAHCCTTLDLATLVGGRWRSFALTFDGGPEQGVVSTVGATGPAVLEIGDETFDYAFASHAGSYLVPRFYALRGGQLYDVSDEPRFAAERQREAKQALGGCGQGPDGNGACAAYVAVESLIGRHDAAWTTVLGLYDKTSTVLPTGCRIDPGAGECPKADVISFASFPTALSWFLRRYGYFPPAPTFPCGPTACPVPPPKTPAPGG